MDGELYILKPGSEQLSKQVRQFLNNDTELLVSTSSSQFWCQYDLQEYSKIDTLKHQKLSLYSNYGKEDIYCVMNKNVKTSKNMGKHKKIQTKLYPFIGTSKKAKKRSICKLDHRLTDLTPLFMNCNFPNLQQFYLCSNINIDNLEFLEFANFQYLRVLQITNNNVSSLKPLTKSNLSNLKKLQIRQKTPQYLHLSRVRLNRYLDLLWLTFKQKDITVQQDVSFAAKLQPRLINRFLNHIYVQIKPNDKTLNSLKRKYICQFHF